jgi:DNA-directed RNA polymerase subunit RPC12/RpoP
MTTMEKMESKNDGIFLWILEQERHKNQERVLEEKTRKSQMHAVEKKNNCFKCKKTFDNPKLVQYYACPHCLNKVEEKVKTGCQYWFGFLSQKDRSESVPQECVECEKVVDCMLNRYYDSVAVSEIKKWY